RLAQNIGKETRSRFVRLAGTNADRWQPDTDALEKSTAAVIGKKQFRDCLLRSIAGQRCRKECVVDLVGERRAEYGDRGREDQPRLVITAGEADRLEQRPRAVQIDPIALFEIGFR